MPLKNRVDQRSNVYEGNLALSSPGALIRFSGASTWGPAVGSVCEKEVNQL